MRQVSQFYFALGQGIVSFYLLNPVIAGLSWVFTYENFTPEEEELCDRVFRGPTDLRLSYNKSGKTRLVRANLLSEQDGKLHLTCARSTCSGVGGAPLGQQFLRKISKASYAEPSLI